MARKFTGRNREIAKFLGESPKSFKDPGFCLGCGEAECECDPTYQDPPIGKRRAKRTPPPGPAPEAPKGEQ